MTDKQLIKFLEKISSHCSEQQYCLDCKFGKNCVCQINRLTKELSEVPEDWNMKRIEEIINE